MEILNYILGGIALVSFLGAAAVYLRGSRDKGTIDTLERSNAALAENNLILNDRVTLLEHNAEAQAQRSRDQDKTIEVLTNTVNSSELITVLRTDLAEHHVAAMAGQTAIHNDLKSLPNLLAVAIKETR